MNRRIIKLAFYLGPFVAMISSLYIFAILSNIVTSMSQNHKYQLNDPVRNLILIDNIKYSGLYTVVNLLPFVICGLYVVIQGIILMVARNKVDVLIEAMFAESVSMLMKGILQIITILPDANPNNPHCTIKPPPINSANLDSCGNMMWSGHASHIIFGLYWLRCIFVAYFEKYQRLCDLVFSMIVCFEALMLIGLQIHYSIDVLLAVLFASLYLTNIHCITFMAWYRDKMKYYTNK